MVRDMGFGSFLGMKIDTLSGKLAYFVVDSFTIGSCSIRVKSGEVAITNETLEAMFGLPNKGLDFNTLDECDKNDPLLEAWKGQYRKGNYYNGNYLKNIKKTNVADELFKLNFLTLFVNTFAETETMGSCRINFIEKLIQCEDVSRINWCEYIVDCLGKSKNKWKPNDKNCYFTGPVALLMMAYVDRVICEDVNLRRHRPFIIEIDSEHLRVLEEYEVSRGVFGNLSLRENLDGVFYDAMMNQDHSKDRSVEESCGIIKSMVGRLVEQKHVVEASSLMCMEMHPNNDKMKAVIKKVVDIFNGTTLKALIAEGHEDRMKVDGMSVNATNGGQTDEDMNQMITNLTNKMVEDLLNGPKDHYEPNVDASDHGMEGMSPTIVKPTGMCNDKVLFEHHDGTQQQNIGMDVVMYNGNSTFDSPCILTPGWIKQADEIERNNSKRSSMFNNDCPSFEAILNECADEMNTSKGNEGKDDAIVE
ncbi:unnamed protein product [Lactuca saligna]|uniref:Uncharacterized protein n=1 Tax=Lactuca saligna TaxID=75948 RepID=A0AA36E697_LACSI|nr:unnamed protein product [Lactuca saligna]CAI9284668.1 unnamed protein product [Lactuca saligna]